MRSIPEYRPSKATMAGRPAVEHVDNPEDVRLVGRSGWMWRCPNGKFAAVITSPRLLNRYYGSKEHRYSTGHSITVYFTEAQARKMAKRIGVPQTQAEQIAFAEGFEAPILASADS